MNIAVDKLALSLFKRPLQECNLPELQQIAEQHPYFGPVQLLLAKKLKEENSAGYEEQVQKTSLYFPNRPWLQYLLNGTEAPATVYEGSPSPAIEETIVKEIIIEEMAEDVEDIPVIIETEELILPAAETSYDKEEEPVEVNIETAAPVAEVPSSTKEPEEKAEAAPEPEKQSSVMDLEITGPGAGFSFEPYHTVDYFASQGIKFKEEDRPRDRFSQQLKSFTEWLKVMKRIPATEIPANDTNKERLVEMMAANSIAEKEVITEAMAEIWEKQGNKVKAAEIYEKLSLLDPAKSAYFAAKIEELKKTS